MMRTTFVESITGSLGIRMSPDALQALAYRLDERLLALVQTASSLSQHCNRSVLTTEDVESALRAHRMAPLAGYSSADPATLKFSRAQDSEDTFFVEDPVVSVEMLLQHSSAALIAVPKEPMLSVHWLSVAGVQPLIPQNPSPAEKAAALAAAAVPASLSGWGPAPASTVGGNQIVTVSSSSSAAAAVSAGLQPARAPPSRHSSSSSSSSSSVSEGPLTAAATAASLAQGAQLLRSTQGHALSSEAQQLLVQVVSSVTSTEPLRQQLALRLVRGGAQALPQLLPFLVHFVVRGVETHTGPAQPLLPLLRLTQALLSSPHDGIDLYLDRLLPPLFACVLSPPTTLSPVPGDPSARSARALAASLLGSVLSRCGPQYPALRARLTEPLSAALLAPGTSLAGAWGALLGLRGLGGRATESVVFPVAGAVAAAAMAHLTGRARERTRSARGENAPAASFASTGKVIASPKPGRPASKVRSTAVSDAFFQSVAEAEAEGGAEELYSPSAAASSTVTTGVSGPVSFSSRWRRDDATLLLQALLEACSLVARGARDAAELPAEEAARAALAVAAAAVVEQDQLRRVAGTADLCATATVNAKRAADAVVQAQNRAAASKAVGKGRRLQARVPKGVVTPASRRTVAPTSTADVHDGRLVLTAEDIAVMDSLQRITWLWGALPQGRDALAAALAGPGDDICAAVL